MSKRQTAARHNHLADGECAVCIKAEHEGDAGLRHGLWAILSILLVVVAWVAILSGERQAMRLGAEWILMLIALATFVVSSLGFWRGQSALAAGRRAPRPVDGCFTSLVAIATFLNGFYLVLGALSAFVMTFGMKRGRQLRRFGQVVLPDVATGAAWATLTVDVSVEEPSLAAVAAQWRENGRTEHASVAAFAHLSLDLLALGAPPTLLADASQDAIDEIRHTELCFSLARDLDGRVESPAPFPRAKSARTLLPGRRSALAAVAVDSLLDGALNEGVSARVVARLAKSCEDPRICGMLKAIAADEGRHSAHGWTVVEWCLAEGGAAVASALRGAVRMLPDRSSYALPPAAKNGAWERYGIPGCALEAEEFAKARADVIQRVERMVAAN